jgi:ubiquinone/menaquinone biosynthesis C-methylase UbiE
MDFPVFLFLLFFLTCLHYLAFVLYDKVTQEKTMIRVEEGFTDPIDVGATDRYLENDELYDSFYASVYDQLAQGAVRTQAEIGLLLHEWTSRGGLPLEKMKVLDAGCGTGIATVAFAKMNVEKAIGLDKSSAMIERAEKVTLTAATLTEKQQQAVEFRNADLLNPSALSAAEVTHAVMFYFVPYELKDLEAVLRNMYVWIAPGGKLAIEVVNKHKFDPMLEAAAPWMAFSLQKYSDTRITKSTITFDKFSYEGQFDLEDPNAEFRETFRFKDGKVRRQRHRFHMPDISQIVKLGTICGYKYDKFIDLTTIGFEYAYLLCFTHP